MSALPPVPASALMLALGWTLLLSVWQTALVALLIWGAMRVLRLSSPALRHWIAMGGLVATVLGTVAIFVWLERVSAAPRVPGHSDALDGRGPGLAAGSLVSVLDSAEEPTHGATLGSLLPVRLVTLAGAVWLAASGVLGVRALGGMLVVWRMRKRAIPLRSTTLREAVAGLARRMGARRPIALLESSDIEAPAALGWWRDALVFPFGLEDSLEGAHVAAIVVHELEHLRRRDPLAAAVQAVIDAALCLCPGARWLSSLASRDRELRCDDAAVRLCGDAAAYASALGALASLGCCGARAPVLDVSGVSLVERIRRILKGETMPRITSLQMAGLAVTLTALAWSAPGLLGAAQRQTSAAQEPANPDASIETTSPASVPPGQALMPFGYTRSTGASPVSLTAVDTTADHVFENVRVRNTSERSVVAVTFLAVVEGRALDRPVVLVRSDPIEASLAPGEAALLTVRLLPAKRAVELKRGLGDSTQAMLTLCSARYADGTEWRITPRPGAHSADAALYTPDSFVSRSLLKPTPPPAPSAELCLDDRGFQYSRGAVVQILGEDGRFARCGGGVWVEVGTLQELAKAQGSEARPND